MIRIFSLYDDSFCDLLCLTFCTVKTHFETMAIEHEYLHHRGKTLAKTQSFFKLVLFTSAFPSKPCIWASIPCKARFHETVRGLWSARVTHKTGVKPWAVSSRERWWVPTQPAPPAKNVLLMQQHRVTADRVGTEGFTCCHLSAGEYRTRPPWLESEPRAGQQRTASATEGNEKRGKGEDFARVIFHCKTHSK